MDRTAAGLERALRTAVDLLRRAHARITPSYPDVKGKGCKQPGFAALDIWFRRRYGREKAASVRPLPPHTSFCCLHPRRTFTQNSGWIRKGSNYGTRTIQSAVLFRKLLPNHLHPINLCQNILAPSAGGRFFAGCSSTCIPERESSVVPLPYRSVWRGRTLL